ncbi:DEAD/DEAH box helicase [Clostridium transplantifaecale]|uniref:DEAD/DEAH box helicase n=1 Tax=Clostridium transplantifaecale TaxID=2479838 RepID=UPI000F62E9F5|nr:DEAD/DEAH box helicase family protein [Clostridium transplantifaecale]
MNYIKKEIKDSIIRASPGTVILLSAPVGSGKTSFCLNELWLHCRVQGQQLLVVVNRSALRGQLKKEIFKKMGLPMEVPIVEQGYLEFDNLIIASYQYLQELFRWNQGSSPEMRIGSMRAKDFDFVAFDEIHYLIRDSIFSAKTAYLNRLPAAFPRAVRIYISATLAPVRNLILELEQIRDLYEDYSDNLRRKLLDFRYIDVGPVRRGVQRDVLELRGAEADFSYFVPVILEEDSDLVAVISSKIQSGDAGKWLIFTDSKEQGKELKTNLITAGIKAAFVAADGMDEDDQKELENVLLKGRFSTQVLLATDVIDNGVSLLDKNLMHLVISGFEAIRAVQQAGRIRVKSRETRIELLIVRHSAEYFNRKRFSYTKKLMAYKVFSSGNEERIFNYLMEFGNKEITGLFYQGIDGKNRPNFFAGRALEYFSTELTDNIERIRKDPDGYIEKVLRWFGLSYNPESDQRLKNRSVAEKELKEFLQKGINVPMTGMHWDCFRKRFRELHESATGEQLCSGRTDRLPGVGIIKKILMSYGYALTGERKIYVINEEKKRCTIS